MSKNMSAQIESYFRLKEAVSFFLDDAFEHADLAAQLEVAALIADERIKSIVPEPDWEVPPSPANRALVQETWEEAQREAPSSGRRLTKTHAIKSVDIIGHIINLSAYVESVINHHLFLLKEAGELEGGHYDSLDRTGVIPKILFAFKDEILSKKLSISRLRHLLRLRNQAVHFKASSAKSIRPTVEELLGIWREVAQLLKLVDGEPAQQQINEMADAIASKWFA